MGFFFTILYILVAYLTPVAIFGEYAGQYHVEEILAVPTILCTIFAMGGSGVSRMNQTYALLGFTSAIAISVALTGWIGGSIFAMLGYLPFLLTFFFVAVNCKTRKHLQILVGVLFFVAVFVIIQSQLDERVNGGLLEGNYYISMKSDAGAMFYRIRGLGEINDPNDFGQFLMCIIPAMFLFWEEGMALLNVFRVYIPISILMYGLFLTHSRGAMLALTLTVILAARKKIGLVRSAIIGGTLVVALSALGFTGDRDVSAANGEDRMGAWGAGLQMIREKPIFGVGQGQFKEHYYMTAHNTVVIVAAETGVVGLFFFTLFLFGGLRDSWVVSEYGLTTGKLEPAAGSSPPDPRAAHLNRTPSLASFRFPTPQLAGGVDSAAVHPGINLRSLDTAPQPQLKTPTPQMASGPNFDRPKAVLEIPQIRRMASAIFLGYVGMLTAGWFLSRAHAFSVFIFGGMAEVTFRIARENGMDVPFLPLTRAMKKTILPTIALVAAIYILLRVTHLMGH